MEPATRTPAQLYALLFGITLLLVGIVGFLVDASSDAGANVQGSDLIVFEVNGWHNLVHIASGARGIALARRADTARLFAGAACHSLTAMAGARASGGRCRARRAAGAVLPPQSSS